MSEFREDDHLLFFATDLLLPSALNIQYGIMGQGRYNDGRMGN